MKSKKQKISPRAKAAQAYLRSISKPFPPMAREFNPRSVQIPAGKIGRAIYTRKLELMNAPRYWEAVHMGLRMKPALEGDLRYEDPAVNFVALQERITGWIMAQPYYQEFAAIMERAFPRDTPDMHAADMALQIVSDITAGNAFFSQESPADQLRSAAADALQCLLLLPNKDGAYRVTCIQQLKKALKKEA